MKIGEGGYRGRRVSRKTQVHEFQDGQYTICDGEFRGQVPGGPYVVVPVDADLHPGKPIWDLTTESDGSVTLWPSIDIQFPMQPEMNWHGWFTHGVWHDA